MKPLFTELLRSVAEHVGTLPERKYCTRCQCYRGKEGSSGRGRQYRCASCTEGRRRALAQRTRRTP